MAGVVHLLVSLYKGQYDDLSDRVYQNLTPSNVRADIWSFDIVRTNTEDPVQLDYDVAIPKGL